MFRASLIESNEYYSLRRHRLLTQMLPLGAVGITLLLTKEHLPVWAIVLLCLLIAGYYYFIVRNQKKINRIVNNSKIEIDSSAIRILRPKQADEIIPIDKVSSIITRERYSIAGSELKDLKNEVAGNGCQNYIVIETDGNKRRFDFEPDSSYMIRRLEEIIAGWKKQGKHIEVTA